MDKLRFKREKKAQVGTLAPFVITLVVVGFIVAIGLTMFNKLGDTMIANSSAANATAVLEEETAGISDWYGIIVLAIIALVVLTIVLVIKQRASNS